MQDTYSNIIFTENYLHQAFVRVTKDERKMDGFHDKKSVFIHQEYLVGYFFIASCFSFFIYIQQVAVIEQKDK